MRTAPEWEGGGGDCGCEEHLGPFAPSAQRASWQSRQARGAAPPPDRVAAGAANPYYVPPDKLAVGVGVVALVVLAGTWLWLTERGGGRRA